MGIFLAVTGSFFLAAALLVALDGCQDTSGTLAISAPLESSSQDTRAMQTMQAIKLFRIKTPLWQRFVPLKSELISASNLTTLESTAITPTPGDLSGIRMAKGRYLLLADCSHHMVTIKTGQHTMVPLKKVRFLRPTLQNAGQDGQLEILCKRVRGAFDQWLRDPTELHLLPGKHRLFIQMVPYEIITQNHQHFEVPLAALRLTEGPQPGGDIFFLSAPSPALDITQKLSVGKWIYLLPGDYHLTIHGSQKRVHLKAGDTLEVPLGSFTLKTPPEASLADIPKVTGAPYRFDFITTSSTHRLALDTTYSVFPGKYQIRLMGATKTQNLTIQPGKHATLTLKALTIKTPCPEGAYSSRCLGDIDVSLFVGSQVIQSLSDIPILYLGSKVAAALHTSFGLKKTYPEPPTHQVITPGTLTLTPKIHNDPVRQTELIRIESLIQSTIHTKKNSPKNLPHEFTEDLRSMPKHIKALHLLPGEYALVAYESVKIPGGFQKQRRQIKRFLLVGGSTMDLTYPVFKLGSQAPPRKSSLEKEKNAGKP